MLLPLKDRASSGRAHTNNFVPFETAAEEKASDDDDKTKAEREGG